MDLRYLSAPISEDLQDHKMVFVGGPRQVGKTTLAKAVGHQAYPHCLYLNWDRLRDQKQILDAIWPGQTDLIILDEIHKYRKWKTWLNGEYDT
jgi:predicted AAA+ superfamily ATPase